MNILLVDDERLALQEMENAVSMAMPTAQIFSFQSTSEALAFAQTTPIDIAFWDINMCFMMLFVGNITSAQTLTSICPTCNVIYCIAQDEYDKDVSRIKRSEHLLKPITSEKVQAMLHHLHYLVRE